MVVYPFKEGLGRSLLRPRAAGLQDPPARELNLSFSQYIPDPKTFSGLKNGKGIMPFC